MLRSFPITPGEAGREGQAALATQSWSLLSSLSCAPRFHSWAPPGPRVPGGAGAEPSRAAPGLHRAQSEPQPPSSHQLRLTRPVPVVEPALGPVPRVLPIPTTGLQQHSTPGSVMPYVLHELAFWGDVFIHSCPANSAFCSFFLWNQRGCHHIIGKFQWHFQACPDLDEMYLLELLAFYFKHVYLFFLQIKSTHLDQIPDRSLPLSLQKQIFFTQLKTIKCISW